MQLWATDINNIYILSYITNIHLYEGWVRRSPSRHFHILKIFRQVKREVGDVSVLVNNAGMVTGKYTFVEAPDNLVDRTLRVNVAAHFWVRKSNSVFSSQCTFLIPLFFMLWEQWAYCYLKNILICAFTDLQGVSPSYVATKPWASGLCGMPWRVVCNERPCRYIYKGISETLSLCKTKSWMCNVLSSVLN